MVTTDLLFYILYKLNVIQGMIFAMRQVHKSMPNFKDFCSMWCWISFLQVQKTCAFRDLEYASRKSLKLLLSIITMKRNLYCYFQLISSFAFSNLYICITGLYQVHQKTKININSSRASKKPELYIDAKQIHLIIVSKYLLIPQVRNNKFYVLSI